MGEVYLATDLALDRPVAIKVLPEALARDARLRDRLIREARAQARVVHANVGHIYYIGEEAGGLYFAMEYVPGETLAQRLTRGPLDPQDALAVIRQAALGLREAERAGILHRDVKPSNLMYDGHGVVKVLDFGLAAGGDRGRAGEADGSAPIAQTTLGGTPLYMAPEQARGAAVDLRADIYALGVTLYQLVAGAPPFEAETVGELVTLHATAKRPRLARRATRAPRTQLEAIEHLCFRMMAAAPADRFASYDALLCAIDLASAAHTRPAGVWVRTMATGFDALIAAAVVSLAMVATGLEEDGVRPTLAVLIAYQALSTRWWGRSPGKALLELEIVDASTLGRPSARAAVLRSLVMFGPVTLGTWVAPVLDRAGYETLDTYLLALTAATLPIGLLLLIYASLRIPGKRAVWDRLAGTVVRYRMPQRLGTL
jgi:hypothetical protein